MVSAIWQTEEAALKKINLSLQLISLEPTYAALSRLWIEYGSTQKPIKEYNERIFSFYLTNLSVPTSDSEHEFAFESSLYFHILEEPKLNREAWQYFLSQNPSEHFIRTLLANSGPVPYNLKHQLHQKLLPDKTFHRAIYISIRHSCFDLCGKVNKVLAWKTLNKLDLADHLEELDNQRGFRKYKDVVAYLLNQIDKLSTP